jgi:quinol monooxygenase YgiN
MLNKSIVARLIAKPGKEEEVASFLAGALPLANEETFMPVWFALRVGTSTFYIFDAFASDTERQQHLSGRIAAALMAKAPELLAEPPSIEQADVLASKVKP